MLKGIHLLSDAGVVARVVTERAGWTKVGGLMLVNYAEGDWFVVPLPEGAYGIGLIARMQARYGGVLLGYFFGPRLAEPPEIDQLRDLVAADAAMVRLFGHRDIRQGRWPVIGRIPEWKREKWPMPTFMRKPSLGTALLVTRLDDDPNVTVSEVAVSDGPEAAGSVPDGLLGSALVAKLLGRAINEHQERVSGGE